MKWLVAEEVAQEMRAYLAAGLVASPDVQASFLETMATEPAADVAAGRGPRNLTMAGDVAQIGVEGLLTERPSFLAWLMGYGNTTYESIQQGLAIADADPAVRRIQMNINSPGGTVAGLFETLASLDATKKPVDVVTSQAASAAYALASRGRRITAKTSASMFGSIGVMRPYVVSDQVVEVTSTQAPKKRPDVRTEEGLAMVREELDALHDLFVDAIARGRGTTKSKVNENFGQGGMLTASEALERGMIDAIQHKRLRAVPRASAEAQTTTMRDATAADPVAGEQVAESAATTEPQAAPACGGAANTNTKKKGRPMDLQTLKAEHPDVYAAAKEEGRKEGHASGVADGQKRERDRVTAHLTLGKNSGAMDTAVAAIEAGDELTQSLTAKYLAAGMNRAEEAARQSESDAAGNALDGRSTSGEKTAEEQAIDLYCAQHGIK